MHRKINSSFVALVLFSLSVIALADEVESPQVIAQNTEEVVAFIGEKIFVKEFPPTDEEIADEKAEDDALFKEKGVRMVRVQINIRLKAKYKILKVVAGDFKNEEIEFVTQDHYGAPRFAKQDPVLLYLKKINGTYFHVRYPYSYVYPTSDGTWASCGTGTELPSKNTPEQLRQVHSIAFSPALTYDISEIKSDAEKLQQKYPTPYFDVTENTARCEQGITVNELVALHLKDVLKKH